MLTKHVELENPANDNVRRLGNYIADASHKGEKCLEYWAEGCLSQDYQTAIFEMEAVQALNTRTKKEKTYHLVLSFKEGDEEKLTPEIYRDIEKTMAKALGFENHQRLCGVHQNTNNVHMHIAYNMIDPVKFNRHSPWYDYPKMRKAAKALCEKYDITFDPAMEEEQQQNISQRAAAMEAHSGEQSFQSYALEHKDKIMTEIEKAQTWEEVHQAFAKRGMEIEQRGNGLSIKNSKGSGAMKASALDRSLSKSQLTKKLGEFKGSAETAKSKSAVKAPSGEQSLQAYALGHKDKIMAEIEKAQTWEEVHQAFTKRGMELKLRGNGLSIKSSNNSETIKASSFDRSLSKAKLTKKLGEFKESKSKAAAKERYSRKPLHQRNPERDELYKRYLAEIEEKKQRINQTKKLQEAEISGIYTKYKKITADIGRQTFRKRDYFRRVSALKPVLQKQLATARKEHKKTLDSIRSEYPFHNWSGFLKKEALAGNATALEILRRQEAKQAKADNGKQSQPATTGEGKKPVKIYGRRYHRPLDQTKNSAIAKMHFLAERESETCPPFKEKIDNRGNIIYQFKHGGILRDCGDKLHFSNDEQTKEIALMYAQTRYGKHITLRGNTIEHRREKGKTYRKPSVAVIRDIAKNGLRTLSQLNVVSGRRGRQGSEVLLYDTQHRDMER